MSQENCKDLMAEFARPTFDEWKKLVESGLDGASYEKKLITKTTEGIEVQPIYTRADSVLGHDIAPGVFPYLRGTNGEKLQKQGQAWDICQEIRQGDPHELNKAINADLNRGLSVAVVVLDEAGKLGLDAGDVEPELVGAAGTSISSVSDLKAALHGVDLSKVKLGIESGCSGLAVSKMLEEVLGDQGAKLKDLRGFLTMDPLFVLASLGQLPASFEVLARDMAKLQSFAEGTSGLRTVGVDVRYAGSAGGSAVDELAFALCSLVQYFRALEAEGVSPEDVAKGVRFSFSLGSDFFMEIAKLRAARALFAKVGSACGLQGDATKAFIHAGSSAFNKTKYGAYTNLLRVTTETFSAVLGGADSIHSEAFDCEHGLADEFSRRIARNTQSVIMEETHVAKVLDPGGGSWYLEQLTSELEKRAWSLFQELEEAGGMLAAITGGKVREIISASAKTQRAALKKGKFALVGSSVYAQPGEELPKSRTFDKQAFLAKKTKELAKVEVGSRLSELSAKSWGKKPQVKAVAETRLQATALAAEYEALRDAAESYFEKNGHRPEIFLATMGPLKQHKARADFTRGFFLAGGFSFLGGESYKTAEEAANAALQSKAKAAVICSTDDTYPELVPEFVRSLRSGGSEILVILAGYPADSVEALREAGVGEFIHLRADQGAVLKAVQEKIGVN